MEIFFPLCSPLVFMSANRNAFINFDVLRWAYNQIFNCPHSWTLQLCRLFRNILQSGGIVLAFLVIAENFETRQCLQPNFSVYTGVPVLYIRDVVQAVLNYSAMRVFIIWAFLAVLGVSSEKKILRIVTWNVENKNEVPANLNDVFKAKSGFDIIFLAIQGVKKSGLFNRWLVAVKSALEEENLELYSSNHRKNIGHFMAYRKQYQHKLSKTRFIENYNFNDGKDTTMVALGFAWHRQNFTIIHGHEPKTDDRQLQSNYYTKFYKALVKNGPFDFFFITGEISYLANMLHKECWRYSGLNHYYSPNKIMYKSLTRVKYLSYEYLEGSDPKPLVGEYIIHIDTTQPPLTDLSHGRLT